MEKLEVKFKLRAGALLEDINDHSKTISQANITDELALHHLRLANKLSEKAYSRVKGLFITLPEDLEELLKQEPTELEDENKTPIIPFTGGVTPQYIDASAPGYVAQADGTASIKEVEGSDFPEEEEALIAEIQTALATGTTKTDIKAKYSQVEKVGENKLTGKLLDALIKEASARAAE